MKNFELKLLIEVRSDHVKKKYIYINELFLYTLPRHEFKLQNELYNRKYRKAIDTRKSSLSSFRDNFLLSSRNSYLITFLEKKNLTISLIKLIEIIILWPCFSNLYQAENEKGLDKWSTPPPKQGFTHKFFARCYKVHAELRSLNFT